MISRSVSTMMFACMVLLLLVSKTSGFATPPTAVTLPIHQRMAATASTTTALAERQWNFNEGEGPWGLKKNAEVWNGRVAQVAFVIIVIQELVQGKGVIQGVQEGDPINIACLGAFGVSILGLTVWLAIKGDDDYVNKELNKKD